MKTKYFDVVVAKEYETDKDGVTEYRTVWNKVGRAWETKNPGSFNFELFLMPGVRYLLNLRQRDAEKQDEPSDQIPNFNEFTPV